MFGSGHGQLRPDGPVRRSVIVVDASETILAGIARHAAGRNDLIVETYSDPRQALVRIRESSPHVLVADLHMSSMTGLELAAAARTLVPNLPVLLTMNEGAERAGEPGSDSIEYLEKPYSFSTLMAMVDRLLSAHPGFSGAVLLPMMPDLIQLYAGSRTTGALLIAHNGERGELWLDEGEIVHAACGDLQGEDAVYRLLTWDGGNFTLRQGARAPERTIDASCEELLLEGFRRIDDGTAESSTPAGWPAGLATDSGKGDVNVSNLRESLEALSGVEGFIGACVVDSNSGMMLGAEGGGSVNLELAAAGNTEVVRAKRKTMASLGLKDGIEDILITLGKQYHLIRPITAKDGLFVYVVLDKGRSNLALARHRLADVEKELVV